MTPAPAQHPDPELLRRFSDGDEEAFTQIVNQYAGLVFCVCNRVLGDRGWAEDVAQETFFRLLKNRRSISQSIGGWLHRAATRLAVDALRSETARRRREHVVAAEAYDLSPDPDDDAGPSWADVSPQLDAALAELPEEERELLVQHFLEGVAQAQIAAERGVSTATLSRRMKDAVASLRLQLARKGVTVVPAVLLMMMTRNAADAAVAVPPSLMGGLGKMAMISGNTMPAPFAPAPAPAAKGWLASRAARSWIGLTAACALGLYLALPYLWLQPGRAPIEDRPAETQPGEDTLATPAGATTTPTTTAPLGTQR
jgi:RNA polymerase sigma-70 factor (ECF subfamily)